MQVHKQTTLIPPVVAGNAVPINGTQIYYLIKSAPLTWAVNEFYKTIRPSLEISNNTVDLQARQTCNSLIITTSYHSTTIKSNITSKAILKADIYSGTDTTHL